uniref:Uncharacterized protein n=1 Tax=Nete virus TaxID=2703871 RepID=A0A6G9L989_9VIRU|nr:MAG: hypothetical protein [Nete virus]
MQRDDPVNFEKAKTLATYIVERHGPEQLGLLKLLSSYSLFREAAAAGTHRKLVGYCQMLSFEKVLREGKNIYYARSSSAEGITFTITDGGGSRVYKDDIFGTVARTLVDEIASLHPDLNSYKRGPVVQLGHGVSVDDAISNIDYDSIESLLDHLGPRYATVKEQFNDHTAAMVDDEKMAKFKFFELVSDIFTGLRKEKDLKINGLRGLPAEFATTAEKFEVMSGEIRKSIRLTKPPTATMKTLLGEAHPDGEWIGNDFIVYEEYDPFVLIGSSRSALSPINTKFGGPEAPAPNVQDTTIVGVECSGDDLDDAIHLVDKYVDLDINTLSYGERVVALYGSPQGEAIWNKISKIKKGMVMRKMPREPQTPKEWVRNMATILAIGAHTADDRDVMLLAAGRTLAYKGQIEFCATTWSKK